MKFLVIFVFCAYQILIVDSKIPKRLPQPCSKSVPNYSKCTYEVLKNMGPHLLKGVREIHFPKLTPLNVPLFIINRTISKFIKLDLIMKNVKYSGYDQAIFENFKFDPKNLTGELNLRMPYFLSIYDYKIDARFFELALPNEGYCELNSTNMGLGFKFTLDPTDNLGRKYFAFKDFRATCAIEDSYFNVRSNNPEQQPAVDRIFKFVNANFGVVYSGFRPIIEEGLEVFYKQIMENVLQTIPAQELIPE